MSENSRISVSDSPGSIPTCSDRNRIFNRSSRRIRPRCLFRRFRPRRVFGNYNRRGSRERTPIYFHRRTPFSRAIWTAARFTRSLNPLASRLIVSRSFFIDSLSSVLTPPAIHKFRKISPSLCFIVVAQPRIYRVLIR